MKVRDWLFAAILTLAIVCAIWADDNRYDRIRQQLDGLQAAITALQSDGRLDKLDKLSAEIEKLATDYRAVIQENSNLKLENQSQKEYIKWLDGMVKK